MNEIVKILGGLCVVILFFLVIGAIWFDSDIMLKLIGTDLILIVLLLVLDKASEDL